MRLFLGAILAAVLAWPVAWAQTTQGLIRGRLLDSRTGSAIPGAAVTYENAATGERGGTVSGASGAYIFPLLSPGLYHIRAEAGGYQPQEAYELELPVAAQLQLDLYLRNKNDVFEQGKYLSVFLPGSKSVVTFYGPDVDTSRLGSFDPPRGIPRALESTVSNVIDTALIRDLPLAGRDVYTMLVTQPGVTADAGTARGLGLSVNGQRPSASNFLLDGLENNNYLITGPLTAVAPEAVQEYRFSTNNFSAEYGRTSGFVANAVTRSGGAAWHGVGYFYLKNDALSANDFQRNRLDQPRPPLKESQPGFSVGGPLPGRGLYASGALEYLRFRSLGDAKPYQFASAADLERMAPGGAGSRLVQDFPPPAAGRVCVRQPNSLQRYLALPRFDAIPGRAKQRLMARLGIARLERPDFLWSPYPGFSSPLTQRIYSPALAWIATVSTLTFESRLGWSSDDLRFDRAHPEVPELVSDCDAGKPCHYEYPGTLALYSYRNRSRSWELAENLVGSTGRHIWKVGGGFLLRRLDGYLTAGRDGWYSFPSVEDFARGRPGQVYAGATRGANGPPDYNREYRYNQFSAFAQDSFQATRRLVFNLGVRYENFGAPRNTGPVKDTLLQFGAGNEIKDRVVNPIFTTISHGDQQLYPADNNDWALRAGFSHSLGADGRTLVRASYGVFYDRPFDNLWQNLRNNSFGLGAPKELRQVTEYRQAAGQVALSWPGIMIRENLSKLTLYQPGIRSSYVQSYFGGFQQQVTPAVALEIDALGSLGRKGVTTDVVNRTGFMLGSPYRGIYYRANQGSSAYQALAAVARFRPRHGQLQLAYTWSHSIDNQSEPLAGDFYDLSATTAIAMAVSGNAGFKREFDSSGDRGSSDFDQRHNFVFFSVWDLPALGTGSRTAALWRGWKLSQLAAFRSGFPFTVRANPKPGVDPRLQVDVEGGRQLLNPKAFVAPFGTPPTLGRNVFAGPGLFNVDLSLSRSFATRALGQTGRVTLRADAFNLLNHANLNSPQSLEWSLLRDVVESEQVVALYGRKGAAATFPALTPFVETARQIQFLLRLEF